MVVLAGTCDRAALLTDYVIAEKVSGKYIKFSKTSFWDIDKFASLPNHQITWKVAWNSFKKSNCFPA